MDYKRKAKDSFKTKLNMFLFNNAINGIREISISDFENFEITKTLVNLYTSEYWQEDKDHLICNRSISSIEKEIESNKQEQKEKIKELEFQYISHFNEIFPPEKFNKLISANQCHYCKITKDQLNTLFSKHKIKKKNFRGWTLEIDRLDSNFEYTENNCVMACYWCNNAKTDEFSESEFLEIAKNISQVWNKRLNNNEI